MITLHTEVKRDFMAVLHPTECTITEEACGDYSLSMTHPLDDGDVWTLIQNDRVICAPVPRHIIPEIAVSGVLYYKVKDNVPGGFATLWKRLPRREEVETPTQPRGTYPAWRNDWPYNKGDKVQETIETASITKIKVFECVKAYSGESTYDRKIYGPNGSGGYWKLVMQYFPGTEVETETTYQTIPGVALIALQAGTGPLMVIRTRGSYYRAKLSYIDGKIYEGYILQSQCEQIGGDAPGEGGVWQMSSDDSVYSEPNLNASVLEDIAEDATYTLAHHVSPLWNYGTVTATGTEGYISRTRSFEITNGADALEADDPVTTEARDIRTQYFRIYSVTISTDNTMQVEARHISYDFEGETIEACGLVDAPPAMACDYLESAVFDTGDDRQIITDFTDDDDIKVTANYSYQNGITALLDPSEGLASKLKAKVMRDNDDFFILKNSQGAPVYQIAYGMNLLGVEWSEDYDKLVTRIFPKAKDKTGKPYWLPANVEGLRRGCVDSPYIAAYPRIRYEILEVDGQINKKPPDSTDGTSRQAYNDETLQAEMIKKARERFELDECDLPNTSVHVEFLKLGDTEEYKQYRGAEQLALYDWVRVYHPQIGMDFSLQVIGYTWDAIKERYESIDIGRPYAQAGSGRRIASWEIGRQAVGLASLTQELKDKLGV